MSLTRLVTPPVSTVLLLAASLGALAFVFVMQFGFGLQPCILCLWQRVPYGVVVALTLLALTIRPSGRVIAVLLFLCAACFVAGMGLAVFHTGVELHWWVGTSSCSIQPASGGGVEDLREQLLHTVSARCDEIAWTLFGLSMANYNIGVSLILAFFATLSAAYALQERPATRQ